ncbi:defensin alpha 5-like [Erinaceus europaeus]|uniref:Defensin alpha 5-like n=1 Tax=Erinaceus europaeus TaxID=9365 RepID=A0ABM3X0T5_ERIEU|nr:defensin alpha 5-like [Erinaceus europaeus]
MRTLALLSVLLLLALQGKAQPLGETSDQLPTTGDQETETEDQAPMTDDEDTTMDQPGAGNTGMSISLEGDAQDASGYQRRLNCYCRSRKCKPGENHTGRCINRGMRQNLCCR